jgi:hypothetical protein
LQFFNHPSRVVHLLHGEEMDMKTKVVSALVCMLVMGFSLSSAEDLYIVKGTSLDINVVSALEGVNVYAALNGGLLVGGKAEFMADLRRREGTIASALSIGDRDKASDYFIFQILSRDIDDLPPEIDVVYHHGTEADARVDEGFEGWSSELVRGLTRVSFIPRSPEGRQDFMRLSEPVTNPDIQEIVDQVSQAHYTTFIQRLQDFRTRYSYTDSCRAAEQWAVDTFAGMGLETELWPYSGDGTWYNAVGRQIGTLYPDSLYLIIGHIDATSENPNNNAPGAEDNASGSACVLEAARVLSQYEFDCTIEYVLVSGEEQGLYGSAAYC